MSRKITADEREAYARQGFVHLEGALGERWLSRLADALARVEREAAQQPRVMNMSALRRQANARRGLPDDLADAASDYILAHNAWRWNDELKQVAFESPLAELSAQLMGATRIRFYFDQVFLKRPGSMLRTAFHQDLGYWTCRGEQICTFWCPIDVVTRENGAMGYVPGSHLWDAEFKANFFIDRKALPGQEGQELPDIEADESRFGVIYCPCQPGDVIVHHVKTIHGSGGNATADAPRRSAAFRYAGDDVVYAERPGVPPDSTPISTELRDGQPLGGELFPLLWERHSA